MLHLFGVSLTCSTISYVLPLAFCHCMLFVILQDSYEVNRPDAWEMPQQITTKEIKTTTEALPTEIFSVETQGLTNQIEAAKKKEIAETAKKCETEIVEYVAQEIQRCEKSTLNCGELKVETITAETLKRRIEIIKNSTENVRQGLTDQLRLVKEGLGNYMNETLRNIEQEALKQVEKTVNKIPEKANNVTMEDLVHSIEHPLNQILKDSRKHAMDRLNMIDKELSEYLKFLSNNQMSDNCKKAQNEKQRYQEEIRKLLEEEIPRHFRECLNTFHDELKKQEERAVEHLNGEAIERSEEAVNKLIQRVVVSAGNGTERSEDQGREGFRQKWREEVAKRIMEEMVRNAKTMKNRIKEETQKIQERAMNLLSHETKNRK